MFLDKEKTYTTLSVIWRDTCSALQHLSKLKESKGYENKTKDFQMVLEN